MKWKNLSQSLSFFHQGEEEEIIRSGEETEYFLSLGGPLFFVKKRLEVSSIPNRFQALDYAFLQSDHPELQRFSDILDYLLLSSASSPAFLKELILLVECQCRRADW